MTKQPPVTDGMTPEQLDAFIELERGKWGYPAESPSLPARSTIHIHPTRRSMPPADRCQRCGGNMPLVAGLRVCRSCGPPRYPSDRPGNAVSLGNGNYRRLSARKWYRD